MLWLLGSCNLDDMSACWPQGAGQALLGRHLEDGGLAGGVEGGGEECCRVCHEDVCFCTDSQLTRNWFGDSG